MIRAAAGSHSARASVALQALGEVDPAMAALSLWCDHRDTDDDATADAPAARTIGSVIRYAPAFETLPRHEQIGLAAHHILHVALRHTARMQAMLARMGERFDADTYNIAADAIVNEALLQAGYALPRPALTLTGLLSQTLGDRSPAHEALAQWDVERLYVRLMQGDGNGNSDAQGAKAYGDAQAFAPDMQPQADADGPDAARTRDTGEDAQDAAQWRRHLARAMEGGRMAGRGIGMSCHAIADIAPPRTPWEVLLRAAITRAVTSHPRPTHRRPARPWIAMEAEARRSGGPVPAFQPGQVRATPVPRVVVALDTSSSVDDARLAMFMAEVAGIARRSGAQVHLLVFDEAVQTHLQIDPSRWQAQLAGLNLGRGGGTSFVPVIAAAMALDPSIIVILTDLEGEFGPAPRKTDVIWAIPDGSAPPAPPAPPFGRTLCLAR